MPNRIAIAVAALIRDHQILMVHRHPRRQWYPDCWDLVGGHIEAGESPGEAVVRECYEELGVQLLDPTPMPMAFSDPALELHAFRVSRWEGDPRNTAPDEHDDLAWFTVEQLPDLTLADRSSLQDIQAAVRA